MPQGLSYFAPWQMNVLICFNNRIRHHTILNLYLYKDTVWEGIVMEGGWGSDLALLEGWGGGDGIDIFMLPLKHYTCKGDFYDFFWVFLFFIFLYFCWSVFYLRFCSPRGLQTRRCGSSFFSLVQQRDESFERIYLQVDFTQTMLSEITHNLHVTLDHHLFASAIDEEGQTPSVQTGRPQHEAAVHDDHRTSVQIFDYALPARNFHGDK